MNWKKRCRVAAKVAGPLLVGPIALAVALARPTAVRADGASEAAEKRERCATRLSIALLGTSADANLSGAGDPQALVDGLLDDERFHERFARYVNAKLNVEPGANAAEDASYTLAKYVVSRKKPWREVFVGKYAVADAVTDDPQGLGYFRSAAWMRRYAGNEEGGYRIVAAYKILQNTTGLELTAVTNAAGVDASAKGREAAACAVCHYQNWYALDKVAKVLSRVEGMGDNMRFKPPNEGPQEILGGKRIANDGELVQALVDSDEFKFHSCRLAFQYLYGRKETTCEAGVFDKCVDALNEKGTMQAGLAAIAKDPSYCQ